MKKIFITLIVVGLCGLNLTQAKYENGVSTSIPEPDIVGYFEFDALEQAPFDAWFLPEYDTYVIDSMTLDQISPELADKIKITIVIGTWCGDSKRETPRFVKILEYLDLNLDQIEAIGVDVKKKAPGTPVKDLNIEFVPTMIFYNNGKEVGRIIESPIESLEKDLLNIVSGI